MDINDFIWVPLLIRANLKRLVFKILLAILHFLLFLPAQMRQGMIQ